jgi:hypothetical protein
VPSSTTSRVLRYRGLKGSKFSINGGDSNGRGLQGGFKYNFSGAILMGGNSGGGSVNNAGSVETTDTLGMATSGGSGNFTVTGGSSGFVSSGEFGNVMGASAGGTSGMSIGMGSSTDVGESNFTGVVKASGNNTFSGQLSGVSFLTPPAPDGTEGDAGATTGNNNAFGMFGVPFATGNTGGFAAVIGNVDSEGTDVGMGTMATGSSMGGGNTFGSSELIATSIFGIAGGTASGAANGTTSTIGSNAIDGVLGNFGGNGTTFNSFNNLGSGFLVAGSTGGGPVAASPGQLNFNPFGSGSSGIFPGFPVNP